MGFQAKSSEIRTGDPVESLERFQQSRAVIEDFSSQTLAAISSDFGRLYYVSSLKDSGTGRYEHDGLMSLYSENAVQAALLHCHEELFARILETPLQDQERDLHACLGSAGDQYWEVIESWQQDRSFQLMCPDGVPGYLQDLFCSNLGVLLAVFSKNKPSLAPAA
ncbi:MAG TPA: hypothetical protein VKT71_05745 [Candidatus Acidoferrales bacterium]|nr:hypothetical protein [Candidatus Acidoferrales bacterium]